MNHLLLVLLAITCNAASILAYYEKDYGETKKISPDPDHFEYVLLDGAHPCSRKCVQDKSPMICKYHFIVENYFTMSKACHNCPRNITDCFRKDCIPGVGYERSVVSVNRQIPGPSIEVCQNDLIVVDVENQLMSEATTIHWHGQHQKENPYMDGVPFITQCPIEPQSTFRYSFRAAQAGTHFWHSHLGLQRVDGCYGPLIVRVPEEDDPHVPFYDYDLSSHVIVLIDWEKNTGMDKFLYHHHSVGDNKPSTLLVNGLGRHREFYDEGNQTYYTPLARFQVEQGYRYRFRIINAGFQNCPVEISVDSHSITVISSDGGDIKPVAAESLVSYAGERFDIILSADQPKSLYWMRFRGLMDCDERFTKAYQVAVLEYKGFDDPDANSTTNKVTNATKVGSDNSSITNKEVLPDGVPNYNNSRREGKQINSLNMGTEAGASHVSMPELSSLEKWDRSLKFKPDLQIFLAFDFYKLNNTHFHGEGYEFNNVSPAANQLLTPQFNHISMQFPSFPLLPQRKEIPFDMFCNENTMDGKDCVKTYCECPHVHQVPLKSVVELVLIDEGTAFDANHPLHLHGYGFRVVAMEKMGPDVKVEQVKERDKKKLIKRNLIDAPVKDTVTVPDGGYTIVRFYANNPGYWIFHCHLESHAEIGMALVFKVGENHEMLPVPEGFPSCGNYVPKELAQPDYSSKPNCSKSSFVNQLEKVLFGDYCQDVHSSSKPLKYSKLIAIVTLLVLIKTLFNN